ncbi:hypothetical protein MXB_5040 [Myxobolus squamalis]|nr:hypothetical protein MXB_5040 [Myxobolus squamalis]
MRLFDYEWIERNPNSRPTSTNIIEKYQTLIPIASRMYFSSFDCNNRSTYENYVNDIEASLNEYRYDYGSERCLTKKNVGEPCTFPLDHLGPCSTKPYGFDMNQPCVYFRILKIFDFNPQWEDKSREYIPVECQLNEENTTFNIYPKGGFLSAALPFIGRSPPPLVSVQTKIDNISSLRLKCEMKTEGLKNFPPSLSQPSHSLTFTFGPALNLIKCS